MVVGCVVSLVNVQLLWSARARMGEPAVSFYGARGDLRTMVARFTKGSAADDNSVMIQSPKQSEVVNDGTNLVTQHRTSFLCIIQW
jgi:hypothetical protein